MDAGGVTADGSGPSFRARPRALSAAPPRSAALPPAAVVSTQTCRSCRTWPASGCPVRAAGWDPRGAPSALWRIARAVCHRPHHRRRRVRSAFSGSQGRPARGLYRDAAEGFRPRGPVRQRIGAGPEAEQSARRVGWSGGWIRPSGPGSVSVVRRPASVSHWPCRARLL